MQLFVPPLGSRLKLEEDWTFTFHDEWRNHGIKSAFSLVEEKYIDKYFDYEYYDKGHRIAWNFDHRRVVDVVKVPKERELTRINPQPVTLPKGTILVLDRIYIRKNAEDFDSLTFRIEDCPNKNLAPKKANGFLKGNARFWAKLRDCNEMKVEVL